MKNVITASLLCAGLICCACSNRIMDAEGAVVPIGHPISSQKLSETLKIDGFSSLESSPDIDLRGIAKVLFRTGTIVVLNCVGDKQDIWVFEEKTGRFILKIGQQSNEENGYDGLNDIAFDGDEIRCSVGGNLSFMNYDLNGNLRSKTSKGVFGEALAQTVDGRTLVYNEYNSTPISGLNHLVFYDKQGNVTKRLYPYLTSQDNNGYAFAGSLTASNGLWFNPPFSDTIFEVVGQQLRPRFFMDFEGKSMPEDLRQKKMNGWDTDKYSFLDEGLARIGRFLVFEYHDEQRKKLGLFDEVTGQFASFRDMAPDYLYELVQLGDIFPKDEHSFALVIRPSRVKYMLEKNLLDLEGLSTHYPALTTALKSEKVKEMPLILYLSFTGEGLGAPDKK